ncbi:hypothetical protein BsWGS_04233 [Bradybaena similaris]
MNSEVRRAIKKRWNRFLDSRTMQNSVSRRRSSRTSMTTFVSSELPVSNTCLHCCSSFVRVLCGQAASSARHKDPQQCNGLDATVVEMHPLKPPDGNGHTVSL